MTKPVTWRQKPPVLLAVVLTAQLMVVLDATIVNVALPHIQTSLHLSGSALSWVLNAYVLTFGGLLLLGARAGDLAGRRRTFLAGIGLFSASSLAGGLAQSGWTLLGARAVQGIGGALAAPAALALLTTAFPDGPARVRAIGLFTTVSAAGGATGLVAGGLLTEWATWRWVMFVNVPIGLAVLAVGSAVLVETPRRRGRLDLLGALTSTAGMTGIVLGLVEAGTAGWASASTLAPLGAGAGLIAVFIRVEAVTEEPILPLRLLASPTRSAANAARGLGYAGMYGMVFFLTQFLQDVQGRSALVTGLGFLPTPTLVFVSSQVTSRWLIGRVPAKTLMLGGLLLNAGGLLVATRLSASSPYPQVLVTLILIGSGMGTSFVSLTAAGLHGVAPADAGAASGLINVVQQVGAALGLAVLVTVFDSVVGPLRTGGLAEAAGPGAVAAHARTVLVHGIDVTFLVAGLFAIGALVVVAAFVRVASPAAEDGPDLEVLTAGALAEVA